MLYFYNYHSIKDCIKKKYIYNQKPKGFGDLINSQNIYIVQSILGNLK